MIWMSSRWGQDGDADLLFKDLRLCQACPTLGQPKSALCTLGWLRWEEFTDPSSPAWTFSKEILPGSSCHRSLSKLHNLLNPNAAKWFQLWNKQILPQIGWAWIDGTSPWFGYGELGICEREKERSHCWGQVPRAQRAVRKAKLITHRTDLKMPCRINPA